MKIYAWTFLHLTVHFDRKMLFVQCISNNESTNENSLRLCTNIYIQFSQLLLTADYTVTQYIQVASKNPYFNSSIECHTGIVSRHPISVWIVNKIKVYQSTYKYISFFQYTYHLTYIKRPWKKYRYPDSDMKYISYIKHILCFFNG